MSDPRAVYHLINAMWRVQDVADKRSMIRELQDALKTRDIDKTLAIDIAKLIDAIQTELQLEERVQTD